MPDYAAAAVYCDRDASDLERVAAKEICRYLFVTTGRLPPLIETAAPPTGPGVWVTVSRNLQDPSDAPAPEGDGYRLKTIDTPDGPLLRVVGGSPLGALYGAYRVAEHLGVAFDLYGDVVPDALAPFAIPRLDETRAPLFPLRGLNAWGSHAEGLDLWTLQDWLSVVSQSVKLGMNFIGAHGYPEAPKGPSSYIYGAEPTIWVGPPEDVLEDGRVRSAYQASLVTTERSGWWGLTGKPTSRYRNGAGALFEADQWGAAVMGGGAPEPLTPAEQTAVFDRTGALFRGVFTAARRLGVKTALGTETPLTAPRALRSRLGLEPTGALPPAVATRLYEGMFLRIARAHPLDYYWIWTPEMWTWKGASQRDVDATVEDIHTALRVAKTVQAPFAVATAGWVLGPPQDRTLFDRVLPKDVPVAEIARMFGHYPIDDRFAEIAGRPKWAIPWLEDDPSLSSPQLWVGRLRKDAVDARRYGCSGLMGLHWRTRILGPNVVALARAAWDQAGWDEVRAPGAGDIGAEGAFGGDHSRGTVRPGETPHPLLGTARVDARAYRFNLPDGRYRVTLTFVEPMFAEAGLRVFDVRLQGQPWIENLDIVAVAGLSPCTRTAEGVVVADGRLSIDFIPRAALPVVCAIEIEGEGVSRKINCGGQAFEDWAADWPNASNAPGRTLAADDFYDAWAAAEFGAQAAPRAAAVFKALDGRFPVASQWVGGAGGVTADHRPWSEARAAFAFVDTFAAVEPEVVGAGARARFAYWLDTFRYARAQARVRCALGAFQAAMARVDAAPPRDQAGLAEAIALPSFADLVASIDEAYGHLLASVSSPGCLGNLLNWEGHILPLILDRSRDRLTSALQAPLPRALTAPPAYAGPPRLIVMPTRSTKADDQPLRVRALWLAAQPPGGVVLHWRPMGGDSLHTQAFEHLGRGVYETVLPDVAGDAVGLEYCVAAQTADGAWLHHPPGAPERLQTVVVHA